MKRFIGAFVAAFAIVLGGYFILGQSNGSNVPSNPLGAAMAQDAGTFDTSSIVEMQIGNPDAPVTIIEYASYTCPHCKRFHEGPFKQLKAEYIDTGKINFIYREVYFDRYGLWASAIARCAIAPQFSQGWALLAMGGGRPLSVFGEWNGRCFLPLSVWSENKFMVLGE